MHCLYAIMLSMPAAYGKILFPLENALQVRSIVFSFIDSYSYRSYPVLIVIDSPPQTIVSASKLICCIWCFYNLSLLVEFI